MRIPNFLWCMVLAPLSGCSGPAGQLEVSPVESRIDMVGGRTLVMPVELAGPINLGSPVDARLDDGRRPSGALYWISVGPDPDADPRGWLSPAGAWYATPASASSRPSAAGVWAVVVDLPADATGQGLWLHGRRVQLNWIADAPTAMPSLELAASPWLRGLLEPERRSPPRRWRWKLVAGGAGKTEEPFEDPVLEALALQAEARWAAAISRLERDDPGLATSLVRLLAATVDFGETVAPAWPSDERELDNLLDDLLSPGLDGSRRADRVRAWMAARPQAVAWVSDDAGGSGQARVATIGVANLRPTAVLTGAAPDDGSLPGDLLPLQPVSAVMLPVPVAAGDPAREPGTGPPARDRQRDVDRHIPVPIRVRAGAWEQAVLVTASAEPARPPGLRVGPLVSDWTMASWLSGSPVASTEAGRGAALLLMKDDRGWFLYIEAAGDPARENVVRVWLGAAGASTAVLRVSSEGFVVDEAASGSSSRDPAVTPVARLPDGRWSCRVAVPTRCIEPDGTLRIGVERVDSQGRRSAWPRPMLPWQVEPGRLSIDTTEWGELGAGQNGP